LRQDEGGGVALIARWKLGHSSPKYVWNQPSKERQGPASTERHRIVVVTIILHPWRDGGDRDGDSAWGVDAGWPWSEDREGWSKADDRADTGVARRGGLLLRSSGGRGGSSGGSTNRRRWDEKCEGSLVLLLAFELEPAAVVGELVEEE